MARTQTMVQLTSEIVEALDSAAQRAGKSRSAIIRDAVEAYLAETREARISVQLADAYRRVPQGATDAWGDVHLSARSNAERTLTRLDAEEDAAGLSW